MSLRILDCSVLLPGPNVAKLFLDQGAEVLKIENPARPDPALGMGKHFYESLNRGKKVVPLNLKEPSDQKKFRELVKTSDGVVEAFLPESKKTLGLRFEDLQPVNPRICVLSLVGYDGSSAAKPGHDLNFQALTGALGESAKFPELPYADLFTVYRAAFQLMAAIHEAKQSGFGKLVEVSFYETMLEVQEPFFQDFLDKKSLGFLLFKGKLPCYGIYHSKDGQAIAVGAIEEKYWNSFCDSIELPELKGRGNDPAIRVQVEKQLKKKDWSHWEPILRKANCCVEKVLDYSKVSPRISG